MLILSNFKRRVTAEPLKVALFTANYTEQVTWRDAATGRLIAESDFFEPMTIGSLIKPGFGGRVYFPTGKGFLVLQVLPKAKRYYPGLFEQGLQRRFISIKICMSSIHKINGVRYGIPHHQYDHF